MKKIVCFGDSVTQGVPHCHLGDTFVKVLERRLSQRRNQQERVLCINSGVGGENTAEGLARIQPAVLDHSPDLVVVEFGLNDIRYEPEKRILPDAFCANLRRIHDQIREAGARVVFTTPNPIINAYHLYSMGTDFYDPWGGCNGAVEEYAGLVRQVAAELGAPLCDVYQAFINRAIDFEFESACPDHTDLRCLGGYISMADGVHPTAPGQELIALELYRVIVVGGLLERQGQ